MIDMIKEEIITWLRIHNTPELGNRTLLKMLQQSTDIFQILAEIERGTYFGLKINKRFQIPTVAEVSDQYVRLIDLNITPVPIGSEGYPTRLSEIYDPPVMLYVRGNRELLATNLLAVVGTRNYTSYGKMVVNEIVPDLVAHGVCVVSGMALGIDTFAHYETLKSNGSTIAVLGSGVDVVAPVQNQRLYEELVNHGLLVSEFPLGLQPTRYTFPQRNRIIAGLSDGVIVIEADEDSGSLITADFALEYGRFVGSVPGSIFSQGSKGANKLIAAGAKIIRSSTDILEELIGDYGAKQENQRQVDLVTDPLELQIVKLVKRERVFIDDVMDLIDQPNDIVLTALTSLEMQGVITRLDGDYFIAK